MVGGWAIRMLTVERLTKVYGSLRALDEVSFRVGSGEVVGLLGPNGAGKTTAIRIVTGFIPATSGSATFDGLDCFSDSLAVRRRLGYMPEGVPLYHDLRVGEHLRFRARLKEVPWRGRRRECARVADVCRVADVLRTPIACLSKGYRKRVGLADALLGDPGLLILDEPTAGLDPNQVREVRALIRTLEGAHTILVSTHDLTEVEMTCARAIIVHRGRVVANEEVRRSSAERRGSLVCELVGPGAEIESTLRGVFGVLDLTRRDLGGGGHEVRLRVSAGVDLRETVGRTALRCGWVIRELRSEAETLEEVFVRHTIGEGSRNGVFPEASAARQPRSTEV
jgi:ABC-2 type transport system ATP-binding protein